MNYSKIERFYATNETIPVFRGFLHFLLSITIPLILYLYSSFFISFWPLLIFILGKFFCYFSSALFHSGLIKSEYNHLCCLKMDKIGVLTSITVTGIPFTIDIQNFLIYYLVNGIIVFLGVHSIIYDYEVNRKAIFAYHFVFNLMFIGINCYFNLLWILGGFFYILSIIAFMPCMIENNNTNKAVEITLNVFWHKKGWYGCHEDFHFLLSIADILTFLNSYYYLKNLTITN